ncbi:MAG TPA: M4 family metallopeptidase [Rhizobiaceae bacterium]
MFLRCGCCIIPKDVLERLAHDATLPAKTRASLESTAAQEPIWRTLRVAQNRAIQARLFTLESNTLTLAKVPSVTVNDCQNTPSLPGKPVPDPGSSRDRTVKRAFDTTTSVVDFYQKEFGRNSIDDLGMTLMSSVHYRVDYNNAFWNGVHMTYGDGDGQLFLDFTRSNDVVAHELTHGVTQYTSGFVYTNEAGGLNESMSDVFGSMFRQWEKNQTFSRADWLIGADIVGPAAKARGYKCLRDLSDPGGKHCLSPQPVHYKDYIPGGDPHDNSGIPNYAFYLAAKAIGGRSWEKAGKVWYAALTSRKATQNMKFKAFAKLTRQAAKTLFPADPAIYSAIDKAWTSVGVA